MSPEEKARAKEKNALEEKKRRTAMSPGKKRNILAHKKHSSAKSPAQVNQKDTLAQKTDMDPTNKEKELF